MPFQLPPRRPSVLAGTLIGITLTVVGCSHITPLGPDAPQPSQLHAPIVLEAMRVQPPSLTGKCPAGYAAISAPGGPTVSAPGSDVGFSPCYRELGPPVTFTSAAVSPYQPRTPSGHSESPGESGLIITLPTADVAALTAVTTRAYDARGAVDISVAGKTWGLPMQLAPLTHGQFAIVLPNSSQTRQLQRLLVPSG